MQEEFSEAYWQAGQWLTRTRAKHRHTDSPRSASLNLIPRLRTGPRPEISPNDILIPCDKLTEKLGSYKEYLDMLTSDMPNSTSRTVWEVVMRMAFTWLKWEPTQRTFSIRLPKLTHNTWPAEHKSPLYLCRFLLGNFDKYLVECSKRMLVHSVVFKYKQ